MSAYQPHPDDQDNMIQHQQQAQLDYYGQQAGSGLEGQQTNLGAAVQQYNDLAGNAELAHLLQQEASKQAAMGMPYGMMAGPMMGMPNDMYRMPQTMMQMPGAPMPGMMEEEPLYVNAKQYNRILKRRQARAKMEAMVRASRAAKGDKAPYMHESRHRHAMKRPRGPGGRFLTAAEIAELKAQEATLGKKQTDSADNDDGERTETDSSGSVEPNTSKAQSTRA